MGGGVQAKGMAKELYIPHRGARFYFVFSNLLFAE
jgi:hypothetical protein